MAKYEKKKAEQWFLPSFFDTMNTIGSVCAFFRGWEFYENQVSFTQTQHDENNAICPSRTDRFGENDNCATRIGLIY